LSKFDSHQSQRRSTYDTESNHEIVPTGLVSRGSAKQTADAQRCHVVCREGAVHLRFGDPDGHARHLGLAQQRESTRLAVKRGSHRNRFALVLQAGLDLPGLNRDEPPIDC
jgi:hypothetical protein